MPNCGSVSPKSTWLKKSSTSFHCEVTAVAAKMPITTGTPIISRRRIGSSCDWYLDMLSWRCPSGA